MQPAELQGQQGLSTQSTKCPKNHPGQGLQLHSILNICVFLLWSPSWYLPAASLVGTSNAASAGLQLHRSWLLRAEILTGSADDFCICLSLPV